MEDRLIFEVSLIFPDGQGMDMYFDDTECDKLVHCIRGYLDYADPGEELFIKAKVRSE